MPQQEADAASYRQAAEVLLAARTVTVVGHLRPDADAIGSVTALTRALRQLGKTVVPMVGQEHPYPENLKSIPGAEEIRLGGQLPQGQDLYVTVDCGSLDRTGVLAMQLGEVDNLLVIDHHASNPSFGTTNLIDTCESTTAVLRRLFSYLDVKLDKKLAHSIYAGLLTDTGSFRWGSPRMHDLAAELMGHGINNREIAEELMDRTKVADLAMIGRVLSGIQVHPTGGYNLAVLIAYREDIANHSGSAVERLIDFVRALDGCEIGAVFKELGDGSWAVSLRSTEINVAKLATGFGGGGHVAAAGYTTYGPPTDVINQLVQAVASNPRGD